MARFHHTTPRRRAWLRVVVVSGLIAAAGAGPALAGPLEDASAAAERRDYATALRIWRSQADHGDARAQHWLGHAYAGALGVAQDYAAAVKWYRQAADQGYAPAQASLGLMYAAGQGVPQDFQAAVNWRRRAADQGDIDGQFGLGLMYLHGEGVPQDYVQAHKWLNLAAARATDRREPMMRKRDEVAARMTPAQLAEAQRLAREWRAAGDGARH